MKIRRSKRKTSRKNLHDIRMYFAITLGCVLLAVVGTFYLIPKTQNLRIADNSKDSLQLGVYYPTLSPNAPTPTPTLPPIVTPTKEPTPTPTPTPTPVTCSAETLRPVTPGCTCTHPYLFECKQNKCIGFHSQTPESPLFSIPPPAEPCDQTVYYGPAQSVFDSWCASGQSRNNAPDGSSFCIGKPVIYLYPTVPTLVSVSLQTSGKIAVSDPRYPTGGWKNILADPSGELQYEGKTYHELFYETETQEVKPPQNGIIIPKNELRSSLRRYVTLLGLTKKNEQDEFLDWWVPKLSQLNAPYILFSVLEAAEKNRIDHVDIAPLPDTFIQFIAYFKPLNKIEKIAPLQITPAPPRKGFTAIEWGGVIDSK